MQYVFNDSGRPVAVTLDGERYDIPANARDMMPGKSLPKTKSLQTTVNSTVEELKDSYMKDAAEGTESILVDIEATHGGYYNKNQYFYVASGMEEMVDTWLQHGGRPYIVNHDMRSEPRGRVQDASFVATGAETGYHALDVEVGNPDEIEMIIDGRALHVSVGSKPVDTVECSICGHDMYHDGHTPIRYTLDSEPSRSVMQKDAPGIFGKMGMDNEDFWKIEENDDGDFTALCRHIRHFDAPMGGDEEKTTGWRLHGQKYKEVSRVNVPADRNDETGEYAHIRGRLDTSDMSDSAAQKLFTDEFSQVAGPTERASFNVASEDELWRPSTPMEAAAQADEYGYNAMFDSGLWKTINARHGDKSIADRAELYYEQGGRFVDRASRLGEEQLDTSMSLSEALQLEDASEFGYWLRQQDQYDREDKRMLDREYYRNHYRD